MSKKIFITLFIIGSLVFSFSTVFATDGALNNAAQDVRNAVGGAENALENAAKDVSGASKNATNAIENNNHNTTNTNIRLSFSIFFMALLHPQKYFYQFLLLDD